MKNGDFPVRKLLVYQRVNQSTHQTSCSNDIPISSVSSTKISCQKGRKNPHGFTAFFLSEPIFQQNLPKFYKNYTRFFVFGNSRLVNLTFIWSPLENNLKITVNFEGSTPE